MRRRLIEFVIISFPTLQCIPLPSERSREMHLHWYWWQHLSHVWSSRLSWSRCTRRFHQAPTTRTSEKYEQHACAHWNMRTHRAVVVCGWGSRITNEDRAMTYRNQHTSTVCITKDYGSQSNLPIIDIKQIFLFLNGKQ